MIRAMTFVCSTWIPALLLVVAPVGGCGSLGAPSAASLDGLPPELAFVVENSSSFTYDPDDAFAKTEPGTVIDDLETLDGCWGAAVLSDTVVGGRALVASYFVEIFHAQSGEYTGWLLQDDAYGWSTIAGGGRGHFSVGDRARIVTEGTHSMLMFFGSWYDTDPETDEPIVAGELITEELAEPRVMDFLATLRGERLRLHFGDAEREPVDPGDDLVYRRFECPGAGGGD